MISACYEDEACIVFDKPSGLLVIPSPKESKKTLINIVNEEYVDPGKAKLHPCHRLDRDTSGVILFAKGKKNQKLLMQLFEDRQINKKYWAIVHGVISKKEGAISNPVRSFKDKNIYSGNMPKDAVTKYFVKARLSDCSALEIELLTGRTNQIRIHFAQIGHPLLGERKYAFAKDYKTKFRRVALHARELRFTSPSGKKINVTADMPNDMGVFFERNNIRREEVFK